jgi:hypothetical protein
MEVTKRRGRRRKKLLDDLRNRRGYSHLKEEALDRTMWRNHFGGGFEPVVRQNTEWMNEFTISVLHQWLHTNNLFSTKKNSFYCQTENYRAGIIIFVLQQ